MKTFYYIFLLSVVLLGSCSPMQNLSSTMEDDIYYVPDKKPLMVQEVETITGQNIDMTSRNDYSDSYPSGESSVVINRQKGTTERISTSGFAAQAEGILNDPNAAERTTLYENSGYWIGGFKGNDNDLEEAARIINQYPQGFGFISNGQDIALNLSFSPDWNVYTDNGRYWWFPSSNNIELYNTFLFGTYPKYIWTVVWNDPFYDSWAFDNQFNFGLNIGWGNPGWSLGFGWNSGFYRPWYNGWYGNPYWGGGWYNPWWGSSWYPGWNYPHYPHWNHPHWGGHYPNWGPPSSNRPNRPGNPRPGLGGGSIGLQPGTNRPGSSARPNYNNQRPGSNVRPGTGITRPDNNTITRPNYNHGRPGSTTSRPNYNTTRPGTTRPTNSNSRPATTRPGNNRNNSSTINRYTRPATRPNTSNTRSNNVKNYNRQPNNYRPTYNNNRSYNRSNNSSYNSNKSSYSAPRISSPSRSGGSPATPSRNTTRSGGRR